MAAKPITRRKFSINAGKKIASLLGAGALLLGYGYYLYSTRSSPSIQSKAESKVTVTAEKTESLVDEFPDYVAFGDKGKPISEFPKLVSANGAKLKGFFTFENRYMVHLNEDEIKQILNGKRPEGYDPNTIAGLGVLTLEPKTRDSVDGISCVLNYGTTVDKIRRELRDITFSDVRLLNPYGACDVLAFVTQTDGSYKFVGRA